MTVMFALIIALVIFGALLFGYLKGWDAGVVHTERRWAEAIGRMK